MKKSRFTIIVICAAVVALGAFAVWAAFQPHDPIALTQEQLDTVLAANSDLTDEQSQLVDACVSIVGKVGYFWGGKSSAIGWDDNWGVPTRVSSAGSETTGTMRPFGLDCSGYVCWAFMQLGYTPQDVSKTIGEGTRNQWNKSTEIDWDELQVGDFAFQNRYPSASGNHIGICVGFLEGEPVFAHCSYSENNVVVTDAGNVFRYARRPASFSSDIIDISPAA